MSKRPDELRQLDCYKIEKGGLADITLVDLNKEYQIDSETFKSKGKNTPFDGWKVKGKVMKTLVEGKVKYSV